MKQYRKRVLRLLLLVSGSCQTSHYNKEYDYNKNYLPGTQEAIVLTNDSPALDHILKNNTAQGAWAINKRKTQQGLANLPIPTAPDTVRGILMNADGSFVIAGGAATGAGQSMIARFLADGSYDLTFAGRGYAVFDASFAGVGNFLTSIISDGTTSNGYFLGGTFAGGAGSGRIGHITYAGGLVTTFGGVNTGIFTAPVATSVAGLVMQSSGNIVYTGIGTALNRFVVDRITPVGVTDTTFTAYNSGTGVMISRGIAVDSQNRIIVVGYHTTTNAGSVYRFSANGGLDTTFNGTGSYTNANFKVFAVAVLPDNSLIVVGDNNDGSFKIIKLTPAGVLDATFGTAGVLLVRLVNAPGNSTARAVTILPNGQIAVVGTGTAGNLSFQIALLHPNGTLDTSFAISGNVGVAGAGTAVLQVGGGNSSAFAVGYQNIADSGLVVAGTGAGNQNVALVFCTDAAVKDNA